MRAANWSSADGIPIDPLPSPRDEVPLNLPDARAPSWCVAPRMDHPDPVEANGLALQDLAGGATGLALVLQDTAAAYGFGLPSTASALGEALAAIDLGTLRLIIDGPSYDFGVAQRLARRVADQRLNPALADISFGLDPLAAFAFSGDAPATWRALAASLCAKAADLRDRGFKGRLISADGRVVHSAGGSEAQELGFILASALAYVKALADAGWTLADAFGAVELRTVTDCDEHLSICKIRSLRRLWACLLESCGAPPLGAHIHVQTAWRTMSAVDTWTNVLRCTQSAMAAALGTADGLTVLPFTQACGLPDSFARRLARNTSIILIEEAQLARVIDPAAGANAFVAVSDALCEAGWASFQDLERRGGLFAALEDGGFQRSVLQTCASRRRGLADGRDAMVGVTIHPNAGGSVSSLLTPLPAYRPCGESPNGRALSPIRLSTPLERGQPGNGE